MNNIELKQQISTLINNRQINQAETLLKPVCTEEQTDVNLWHMYASVHYIKGDLEQLEKCCHQIIKLQPDDVSTLFNLGCIYVNKNDMTNAERYFSRTLSLNPKHSAAHDNLGQLYEEKGQLDKAKLCFENALQSDNVQAIYHRHLGLIHLKEKKPAKAEICFADGMKLDASDAKAHVELGRAQCELGKTDDAIVSFNRALEINPDLNYARFWLSAISDQRTTDSAKHRFVSRLFDGHAEDFDKILVNQLGYKTPWLIAKELSAIIKGEKKLDILDIGCGTGLCAEPLKSLTRSITGIDLSANMLAKAEKRDCYKELLQGDIVEVMSELPDKFDLVLAADVFVYVGGLTEVFDTCRSALVKDGLFIFSVEESDHNENFMLRATGRYAHSANYINKLAAEYGFEEVSRHDILLRTDGGKQISGQIFILRLQ